MKKQRLLVAWALLSVASLEAALSQVQQVQRIIDFVASLQTPTTSAVISPVTSAVFATSAPTATPAAIVVPAGQTIASLSVDKVWSSGSSTGEPTLTLTASEIATLNALLAKQSVVAGFNQGNNLNFVIGTTSSSFTIKHLSQPGQVDIPTGFGFGISYSLSNAPNTMIASNNVLWGSTIAITGSTSTTTPAASTVMLWSLPATFAALKAAIPTLTVSTSATSTASSDSAPISFNINVGPDVGFAFLSNPWNSETDPVVPGLSWDNVSAYANDGMTLVLLGFDKNMNVILDFTKTSPTAMSLLMYDTKTGVLITSVPFDPVGSGTLLEEGTSKVINTNGITVGEFDLTKFPSGTYPVAFPITFAQSTTSVATPEAPVAKTTPTPATSVTPASAAISLTAAQQAQVKQFISTLQSQTSDVQNVSIDDQYSTENVTNPLGGTLTAIQAAGLTPALTKGTGLNEAIAAANAAIATANAAQATWNSSEDW